MLRRRSQAETRESISSVLAVSMLALVKSGEAFSSRRRLGASSAVDDRLGSRGGIVANQGKSDVVSCGVNECGCSVQDAGWRFGTNAD